MNRTKIVKVSEFFMFKFLQKVSHAIRFVIKNGVENYIALWGKTLAASRKSTIIQFSVFVVFSYLPYCFLENGSNDFSDFWYIVQGDVHKAIHFAFFEENS